MSQQIRKTLNSPAGKELKEFLLQRLNELAYITEISEKDSVEEQVIEVKAQKRAFSKLEKIYKEIMTLGTEPREKDPRDSYRI